jgi:uncharacterized transporter YbjL
MKRVYRIIIVVAAVTIWPIIAGLIPVPLPIGFAIGFAGGFLLGAFGLYWIDKEAR